MLYFYILIMTNFNCMQNGLQQWLEWDKEGFILSHLRFATVIDWITKKALTGLDVGLEWINDSRLCDLDNVDDIALLCCGYMWNKIISKLF